VTYQTFLDNLQKSYLSSASSKSDGPLMSYGAAKSDFFRPIIALPPA
jgi:hypothetical protein